MSTSQDVRPKTLYLCVGGPLHGREVWVHDDHPIVYCDVPRGGEELVYNVRKVSDPETRHVRRLLVAAPLDDEEADRLLRDLLLKQWINHEDMVNLGDLRAAATP
jgi:hypothetical protein